MPTMVVVAQNAIARVFRHARPGAPLEEVETLVHPGSTLRNTELTTDVSGQVRESANPGGRVAQPETLPKEHEAQVFAKEVAELLHRARLNANYRRAVVLAAPGFLGLLRDALSHADRGFIEHEIAKNVATQDPAAIVKQLDGVLRIGRG